MDLPKQEQKAEKTIQPKIAEEPAAKIEEEKTPVVVEPEETEEPVAEKKAEEKTEVDDKKPQPEEELIDTIVARVNGVDVDARDYFDRLARITGKSGEKITMDKLTKNTVDRLINDKLLEVELEKLEQPITDEDIAKSLGMDQARYLNTKDKMKARLDSERRKLAVARLLKVRGLLKDPTEEELKTEYAKRKMIRLNVVHFKVDTKAKEESVEANKGKAEEFLGKVKAGQDFKAVARELHGDKLGRRAVRPMIIREGQERHKAMWDAASQIEENGFGGPVRTRFGWAVFSVIKKISPKRSFDEMKERLGKTVISQKAIQAKKRLIDELRTTANVEYLIVFSKRPGGAIDRTDRIRSSIQKIPRPDERLLQNRKKLQDKAEESKPAQ